MNRYVPDEGTAVSKVAQVGLVAIHVSQVVLATHQQNRSLRAEATDLRVPHRLAVPQRHGVGYGKT